MTGWGEWRAGPPPGANWSVGGPYEPDPYAPPTQVYVPPVPPAAPGPPVQGQIVTQERRRGWWPLPPEGQVAVAIAVLLVIGLLIAIAHHNAQKASEVSTGSSTTAVTTATTTARAPAAAVTTAPAATPAPVAGVSPTVVATTAPSGTPVTPVPATAAATTTTVAGTCNAQVENPNPQVGTTDTVTVSSNVVNTPVNYIVRYPTGDQTFAGRTDGSGNDRRGFVVAQTPGTQPVPIIVDVSGRATCQTAFTPR